MHLQRRGQGLFSKSPSTHLDDFPVTPHVDSDEIKVGLHGICDIPLRKVVLDQGVAVGAACLPEIEHEPTALSCCFIDIFLKVEKTLLEPARMLCVHGAQKLAQLLACVSRGRIEQADQHHGRP